MKKHTYVVTFHAINRYGEEDYRERYQSYRRRDVALASARIFKEQRPYLRGYFTIDRVNIPYDEAMENLYMLKYLWANDLNTITVGRV